MAISKRPTIKTAEDFIAGAAEATTPEHIQAHKPNPEKRETMPWDDLNPRIVKGINLRLTEPVWGKLDFLKQRTNKSIQKIIMDALLPEIDKQIEELTGTKK